VADVETYRDWQIRTREANEILSNKKLKLWQKVHMVGGAYAGLTLSGLRSKHRHRFLNRISELNKILAQYQLESFDDYQNIKSADLKQMILIGRKLACPTK